MFYKNSGYVIRHHSIEGLELAYNALFFLSPAKEKLFSGEWPWGERQRESGWRFMSSLEFRWDRLTKLRKYKRELEVQAQATRLKPEYSSYTLNWHTWGALTPCALNIVFFILCGCHGNRRRRIRATAQGPKFSDPTNQGRHDSVGRYRNTSWYSSGSRYQKAHPSTRRQWVGTASSLCRDERTGSVSVAWSPPTQALVQEGAPQQTRGPLSLKLWTLRKIPAGLFFPYNKFNFGNWTLGNL